MTTLQAIGLGAILVLTPSLLVWVWILGFDKRLPPYRREVFPQLFEDRVAADLNECVEHILHHGIGNSDELAARLRLIGAARRCCVAVGLTVTMNRRRLLSKMTKRERHMAMAGCGH